MRDAKKIMMDKQLARRNFLAIVAIIGISLSAILFTNMVVLRDFPNSGDEYSYLVSAKLFADGKLSIPSPEPRDSFIFFHIINDGNYYGKYGFGWPLFLMIGVLAGFPVLMNVVFGILSLLLIFLITRELFSDRSALMALFLMAISPFFIFNSASYFSHSSALFFTLLFSYLYCINIRLRKTSLWFLMGLSLGLLFNIRQLDAAITGVFFFCLHIYQLIKNEIALKDQMNNAVFFLAGLAVFASLYFYYNYVQTGNPLLPPFLKYNPKDHLGFNNGYLNTPRWSFEKNVIDKAIGLTLWVPLSPAFMAAGFFLSKNKKRFLIAGYLLLFWFVYFFYARNGINQYGPRYLYTPSFCVFMLMALGFEKMRKPLASAVIVLLVLLNIGFYSHAAYTYHTEIDSRMAVYDAVKKKGITNAVVFLSSSSFNFSSGSMQANDLTRNDITFKEPVVYVHDRGPENKKVMELYHDRSYHLWKCQSIDIQDNRFLNTYKSKNINCTLSQM